ncbi:MAG: SDR family NAD(P)-dependent oxidoreductase [Treponemataceae bacterium]|nr:SDR family NAD(P)-dependent oxidoreductase [Treponemataceae bacterium]
MKKLTIITGASSGLGAEFARQIAAGIPSGDRHELWLIARNQQKLAAVAAELAGTNAAVRTFALDLGTLDGVHRIRALLEAEHNAEAIAIDTLVNNAGFGTYGPFAETDIDREMQMIELNCTTLTGICGIALPYLRRGSTIINVASLAAFLPLGNFAVYAATKAFVLSFSVALAAELKDAGVTVSALCPGSVRTNFANVASNGKRAEVLHGKDPAKTVRHCLAKSRKGKKIILWARSWKCTAFLSRFVGRYAGARFTYLFRKRPH